MKKIDILADYESCEYTFNAMLILFKLNLKSADLPSDQVLYIMNEDYCQHCKSFLEENRCPDFCKGSDYGMPITRGKEI